MRAFCVRITGALMLLPLLSSAMYGMEFTRGTDDAYIIANGEIAADDGDRLRALLAGGSYAGKWIVLSSGGGSVGAALDMGRLIRRWNMNTMVAPRGDCLSACLLVFIGGEERAVGDSGRLGSHQFRWTTESHADQVEIAGATQDLTAQTLKHFLDLGIDPAALSLVMRVSPDEMYIFNPVQLDRYRLVGRSTSDERVGPVVSGSEIYREGCGFPDDFIASDPLRLYTHCY